MADEEEVAAAKTEKTEEEEIDSDLLKQKATAQGSFTRTFNALERLVGRKGVPLSTLRKSLDDLDERFKTLEARCEAILNVCDESNPLCSDIDSILAKKYDLLTEMRGCVSMLEEEEKSADAASEKSETKDSENTAQLIKSFKASLTLPKPQTKKFDGHPKNYSSFMSYFETYVEHTVEDDRQCLSLLIDSCTDIAYDSISYLSQCKDSKQAYSRAKEILKELFGGKHQVNRAIIEECTSGPSIKIADISAMKRLMIALQKAEVTLKESGFTEELSSTDQLKKVYHRLPRHLQYKWNDKVLEMHDKSEKPSFRTMYKLLDTFIRSRDNEYFTPESESSKRTVKHAFVVSQEKKVVNCVMCKGEHYLNQCEEFKKFNVKERYEFVSKNQLCRNCLHKGHVSSNCKRKGLCKKCNCKHNDVLHDSDFTQGQIQRSSSFPAMSNSSTTSIIDNVPQVNSEAKPVYTSQCNANVAGLACVEVLVEGKDAFIKCKAIVDSKSSANLCTKRLANQLNLQSKSFETTLNVATGNYAVKGSQIVEAKVYCKDMSDFVVAKDIMAIDSIPLSSGSLFTQDDISAFSHLKNVEIPIVTDTDEISLVIGSGVPKAFHQFEQCKGNDNGIYAVRQTLGWDLVGPKNVGKVTGSNSYFSSMSSVSESVFFVGKDPVLSCSPTCDIQRIFNADFADNVLFSDKVGMSPEDKEAQGLVERSMEIKEGQFCVGIPWKQNPLNLPSSKEIVVKRLASLKSRFLKDAKLFQSYKSEMKKYIDNNYLELSTSSDSELYHFVPHHPVWHPRKKSLRIVWDCAVSLNDFVHEGPDLLNSIVDILIRFRRFKYAVCSDIRKMYLSVKIPPNDRGALRVLWWPEGDLSAKPVEYRATVHIFGAKSSGFVANYCVRKLASNTENPKVSETLHKDLYVDDQVSSFTDEESAIAIVKGMRDVLQKGGFHLTKFMSNSNAVMNSVPESDRGDSVDLKLTKSFQVEHSTLGLKWEVDADVLRFPCSVPTQEEIPTRRLLLSVIARVYDPLGVVSPVTLPIKVIMQEKSSIGWDDTDDEMKEKWKEFCKVMHLVSEFHIPRCYKPSSCSFDVPVHISLHGFSDASHQGYCAVVYIRQVAADGQISVSFVVGKSRVAPKFKGHIPQATVPKLELNAAALLAKLMQKVKDCIDLPVNETVYWCDSQAVLSCICSTNRRFPVYWSNRLAVIHGLSKEIEWRFVPTKSNPADIGSRGVQVSDFNPKMNKWVNGPSFLMNEQSQWPQRQPVHYMENVMMVSNEKENGSKLLDHVIQYYSSLPKLVRVIARLLKFMKTCKTSQRKEIDSNDLKEAMNCLSRYAQKDINPSHVKRLKPFKDPNGVMRANSRLSKASHLSYDVKFPIILPKNSHFTNLVIEDEHQRYAHMGPKYVLTQLRQRYWLINGIKSVKNVISQCRKCKEENARSLHQEMSPLPDERIKPSFPFQFVGVDYFGPFLCKVRRQRVKRYGCIFVCLSTRAIHLECVNSLETSSFLSALSRFISRRGLPEKMFSDNATNFKGAQEELKDVMPNEKEVSEFARSKGITWHFHPPYGSHHAGHYERLIRSVRKVLRGLTNEQEMSEDNLVTFLCEAEKILNDRPITSISNDVGDDVPLTPSMVLLLRGNSCKALFDDVSNEPKCYHRQAQYLASIFWTRWLREYVPLLVTRQKWFVPKRSLKVGDIVLMSGEGFSRGHWPLARVVEVYEDSDNLVRKVMVKDKSGVKIRPITKLALLEASK